MKKVITAFFALLFLLLTISGSFAAEKNSKPEIKTVDNYIAVFDFEVTTGDKGISRPLTESVRREIVMSGKYKVIDRGNMEKILGEQKLQMSGCVTGECIVEAGQLLGVGKLISGTVSIVGKTYYLTLSLISVKTGEIENVADDKCKCEVDELLDSIKRLAKKLLGEKVEQIVTTVPKPSTAAESKTEAIAMAKNPPQPAVRETARDGRFIAYDNGTILDTSTNLMWAAKGSGSNINWSYAKIYCENYRGGSYTDWRMPTQDELAGLYDAAKTYKSDCGHDVHLTELIRLTCFGLGRQKHVVPMLPTSVSSVADGSGIPSRTPPAPLLSRCVLANRLFGHLCLPEIKRLVILTSIQYFNWQTIFSGRALLTKIFLLT